MVFEDILGIIIVSLAGLAAAMGILLLESFFRDKFQDLFDDRQYFIFFFLVSGYFLYALGEVAFYLTKVFTSINPQFGMGDVYWVGGAAVILISFIALTISLSKDNRKKLLPQGVFGVILLGIVSYILWNFTIGNSGTFFQYYYPIMSALIVAFSLSVLFYYRKIEDFDLPLLIFSLASLGILLGDIFFSYVTANNLSSGNVYLLGDVFYCLGYGLSFLAFVVLYMKMRTLAK